MLKSNLLLTFFAGYGEPTVICQQCTPFDSIDFACVSRVHRSVTALCLLLTSGGMSNKYFSFTTTARRDLNLNVIKSIFASSNKNILFPSYNSELFFANGANKIRKIQWNQVASSPYRCPWRQTIPFTMAWFHESDWEGQKDCTVHEMPTIHPQHICRQNEYTSVNSHLRLRIDINWFWPGYVCSARNYRNHCSESIQTVNTQGISKAKDDDIGSNGRNESKFSY